MSGANREIYDATRCGSGLTPYQYCVVRRESI